MVRAKIENAIVHITIHENNSCENDIVFDLPLGLAKKVTQSYINMVARRLIEARQWSQLELDGLYR
jgi:hypothetical protein